MQRATQVEEWRGARCYQTLALQRGQGANTTLDGHTQPDCQEAGGVSRRTKEDRIDGQRGGEDGVFGKLELDRGKAALVQRHVCCDHRTQAVLKTEMSVIPWPKYLIRREISYHDS